MFPFSIMPALASIMGTLIGESAQRKAEFDKAYAEAYRDAIAVHEVNELEELFKRLDPRGEVSE